jgi:transposase-like protein
MGRAENATGTGAASRTDDTSRVREARSGGPAPEQHAQRQQPKDFERRLRQATFEPKIVARGQTRWTGFDDKIVSLYAQVRVKSK